MSEASSVSGRSAGLSETSSQAEANEYLKKRHHNANAQEEEDLLEQSKTVQEAVFSSMYTLAKAKTLENRKMAVIKVVLEALVPFLIAFNTTMGWPINTSNPVWQVVRWALPRAPVARIWGYSTYIIIFYIIVAMVFAVLVAIASLTLAMRKQDHSKLLHRLGAILQKFTDLMFSVFYVAIFDFIVFLFSCHFGSPGNYHSYWTEVQCLSGSHLIHLSVAGATSIAFFIATALLLVAGCELNPLGRGILASPAALTRVRVLALKAIYVIVAATLGSIGKVQAVLMVIMVAAITWFNFSALPFLRFYINDVWTGGWVAVLYTVCVHVAWKTDKHWEDPAVGEHYVMYVLYGVFPAMVCGAITTTAWSWFRLRPVAKFIDLPPTAKLKKVHVFRSPADVEVLSRAMRRFDTDGIILEDSAVLGENIIKCGMAVYQGDVGLLILSANYQMEVKRDGPAARTQLQLALKGGPSIIQRYQIFYTVENSKRLKDGQEGQLDLQSYVEFKRNYRAVIRVHKAALGARRDFWQLMLRASLRTAAIEATLREMDAATEAAHQVYKRVLERYPNNGKLLRCYGKFLEDVLDDPVAATRAYMEASRNGGGDGLLSLDLKIQGTDKPDFLTSMDLHEDACIVINAEGKILMVNACVTALLGYPKVDLENANVSMIMPQPFSGRHPSYLTRYVQGGEPRILDTVRDVVALHKERYVLPLRLCVTKLSGVGTDAVFLGLLRQEPLDSRNVRAWLAPNGLILCSDPQFASVTGMTAEEMVGRNFQSLVTDVAAVDALLEQCKDAPYESLVAGTIVKQIEVVHRYLPPVPVEVKVTPGGTDSQRIFVFNAHRVDEHTEGLMVCDSKGSLTFATWDVAAMLGYPLKKFLKMKMEQLLPPPYATMHAKYLRDPPSNIQPNSCRAGALVHLVNSNGALVPVRLQISTKEDSMTGRVKHVVQVTKMDTSSSAMYLDKKLSLICTMDGRILSVDQPNSNIFGFAASTAVGSNLADCIDVFTEWREKAGAHQVELLLLSLLDRETEMPGTSWRVKVHSPENEDSLPNIDPTAGPRVSRGVSACLQSEIIDITDERTSVGLGLELESQGDLAECASLARIVLWRRNLLSGVIELDEHLVMRRADANTGLIVGLPPSTLPRMPLSKLLDIPKGISWDDLMNKDKKKKSALKGVTSTVVSVPKAFIGPHPDGGSMRIIVQGVSGGSGGRITATLHPDTTYTGARANVYLALGLDAIINKQHHQHDHDHDHDHDKDQDEEHEKQRQQEEEEHRRRQQVVASHRRNHTPERGPAPRLGAHFRTDSDLGRSRLKRVSIAGPASHDGGESHADRGAYGSDDAAADAADMPDGSRSGAGSASVSSAGEDSEGGADGKGNEKGKHKAKHKSDAADTGDAEEGDEAEGDEHLHRRARSQSEFIAQWVRSLSRQMTAVKERHPEIAPGEEATAAADSRAPSRKGTVDFEEAGPEAADGLKSHGVVGEDLLQTAPPVRSLSRKQSMLSTHSKAAGSGGDKEGDVDEDEDEDDEDEDDEEDREISRRLSKMESNRMLALAEEGLVAARPGIAAAAGGPEGVAADGGSSVGDDDDAANQGGGGPAFSDASSAQDVDLATDARRGRLLKRMLKVMAGPTLALPVTRLKVRTMVLLSTMVLTHVVCYVILINLINQQFSDVRAVHRLALAADRCQVAVTKAAVAEFCARPHVAPVGVCEVPLSNTISDLRASLDDLEVYHQGTYLGMGSQPVHPSDTTLEAMWTHPSQTYKLYMDINEARWTNLTAGVWQLGNRFIAAGRELLYWGVQLEGHISGKRALQFLLDNGPWSLFKGYTVSLDYLAKQALDRIAELQIEVLVLLIVEAAIVQLACVVYEWILVRRVEMGRVGSMLVGLGLPGPILRILANKPLVVMEDSDDDEDDDDDEDKAGDGDGGGANDPGGGHRSVDGDAPAVSAPRWTIESGAMGASMARRSSGGDGDDGDRGGGNAYTSRLNHGLSAGSGVSGDSDPDRNRDDNYGDSHTGDLSERVAGVEDLVPGAGSGAIIGGKRGTVVKREGSGVRINGKVLTSSPNNLLKFMLPLALWEAGLVVVLVVSYLKLEGMQQPLATLNMASRVIYRYTRVRMTAFLLVAAEQQAERADWRGVLKMEVDNLQDEYDTLMYGGIASTQVGTVFDYPVPASTFESATFAADFFREERCFRWDQSKCYNTDSEYYEVTHHGLDVMIRRIISEMNLLVADDDVDAVYNGTRYTTMYMVGIKDMYEGLQSSAQLFMDYMLSRYNSIKLLHTIMLVCTIVLFAGYALLVLRPYLAAVEKETVRLAGLLSHVPAEMDVVTHVRQVLRSHARLSGTDPLAATGEEVSRRGTSSTGPRRMSMKGSQLGGKSRAALMKGTV